MMISFRNITKNYGNRCIFHDFSYDFPKTGLVAIVGESGSGKSTLLNLISGLDFDYNGSAKVLDKDLKKMFSTSLANFRLENIGYVFQNFNLLNLETVFNNVCLPLDTISNAKANIKRQRVHDCLKLVGMEKMPKARVQKLSGGEKQRVAIARSIVNDPKIILCDEPTGALDEKNSEIIFSLLKKISSSKLVVVATHDVEEIAKIANVILEIKNEKIIVKTLENPQENSQLPLIGIGERKEKPRVSLMFKIKYSLQKMKAKKFRSIIMNLMLSLSLTGVGLSLLISGSVSEKVNDAFETILNGNQIIVSTKGENVNTFSSTYSSSFKNVYKIFEKYKYHLDGIGVNYLVNFEDFFKSNNYVCIESDKKSFLIDSLSARNINDFKWLDEGENDFLYPFNISYLDDDEVVLGLSQKDMNNLCYILQIQRNYSSLGHYIYEHNLSMILNVENSLWEYDDQQIFRIAAVKESTYSCIYHTNQLWNEVVFEEMMRLPSDDNEEHYFPWEMYKIYYLKTKNDPNQFLTAAFYDPDMDDFVFERTNYNFNPTICSTNNVCQEKRVFIYSVDKYGLSPSFISKFDDLQNYYFTSDFGYASYASNLFSGFSKNVFIATDNTFADQAIDADTQIGNEENLKIDLPNEVVQGNFLYSLSDGLRFSTKFDKLIYGRKPTNLNEIVISKGLAEKFDKSGLCIGKYLTFAGEIEEFMDSDGRLKKDYNKTQILVVGVVDEPKNYIYHNHDWTISFFRDKLGVSNFLLIPKSCVLEFDSKNDAQSSYEKINQVLHEYKITDPLNELESNVDSTLDYANTILIAFSLLSIVISILLLGTVLMLNIIEGKDEISMFNYLGITRRNINSIITYNGITQGLIAFIFSSIELIVVDFVISYILGDYLSIGFKFSFNSVPILVVFFLAVFIPWFVSKIMLLFIGKKNK